MPDYRHAGMHWPTGGENPNRDTIYNLPGVSGGGLIMLADSARFWYNEARHRSPLVVWRGLPRPNMLPAHLGWDPVRVAQETVNLWNEQIHTGTEYFTPLNELQFAWESGSPNFPGFEFVARFLERLRVELRKMLPWNVKLVWPAWSPDQPYPDAPFDAESEWVDAATKWDVIGIHVYSHNDGDPSHFGAANVRRTHEWYSQRFPHHPIIYTEWNANHTNATEHEMLEEMARICAEDPFCLGYLYYIWQTQRQGEQQLSVWGNSERYQLFSQPPVIEGEPELPVYPLPEYFPQTQQTFDEAKNAAAALGIDLTTAIALLIAESGYDFNKLERWNRWTAQAVAAINAQDWSALQGIVNQIQSLNSDDISFGPAHQAYRWSPEYDNAHHPTFRYDLNKIMAFRKLYIEDYGHALRIAYTQLKHYLDIYGDPLEALCRYNRPSVSAANNQNRGNYANALSLAPQRIAELSSQPEEPEEPDVPEYHFGFKDLYDQLGHDVVGAPLTDEEYISENVSMQFTENGFMMYSKLANKPYFFEAAR